MSVRESKTLKPRNILSQRQDLPSSVSQIIDALSNIVRQNQSRIFLVGGFVRDLLLRGSLKDMDVVIEGNSQNLAHQLAKEMRGEVHSHGEFGTYGVLLSSGMRLDIAMARREFYPKPAALPEVKPGTLEEDLQRRDFTMNAIAIEIDKDGLGDWIDPFRGREDIDAKKIRALHKKSFIDDPTRIFRAIRYQHRLGFSLESNTARWIMESMEQRIPTHLSGKRLFTELKKISEEEDPTATFQSLEQRKLFPLFDKSIQFGRNPIRILRRLKRAMQWVPSSIDKSLLFLLPMLSQLLTQKISKKCREWSLPRYWEKAILQSRDGIQVLQKLTQSSLKPSRVYRMLVPYEVEPLVLFWAQGRKSPSQWIKRYLTELKGVCIWTTGEDLKRHGIPPGPLYRKIMEEIKDLTLDGKVRFRKDEETFLKGLL